MRASADRSAERLAFVTAHERHQSALGEAFRRPPERPAFELAGDRSLLRRNARPAFTSPGLVLRGEQRADARSGTGPIRLFQRGTVPLADRGTADGVFVRSLVRPRDRKHGAHRR
jgi:hypothetical protein